jgi:hypothetical protein
MRSAPVSIAASHEEAHALVVRAAARGAVAGLEDLADLGVPRREPALGLAAEHLAHAPRRDLDLEARVVRGGDDRRHRLAVVGQVVLGEGVQHAGEALGGERLHVGRDVARDPAAEVGDPGAHPFTAPAVMPSMSRLRSTRKNRTTGSV